MHCQFAAAALLALFSFSNAAMAGECAGNPDALGTSRVITLDSSHLKRLGTIQYKDSLPLEDREVVLTFDDGPLPPHTDKVLDALAAECVKATFFVVGDMARAHPATLQRAYREGHTIGTHSEHHGNLDRLPSEKAQKEISDGVATAAEVLGDRSAVAPFFRFPYLDMTGAIEAHAVHLGLSVWSADFHASDWNRISAEKVTALALSRLESKKKGIILLHDIHERTASALPVLLRQLKKRGYKIVHVVPAAVAVATIEEKTASDAKAAAVQEPAKPELANASGNTEDVKAAAKTEQAALAAPQQASVEKAQQAAAAPVAIKPRVSTASIRKVRKNTSQGKGWRTHVKRQRKVTAEAKPKPNPFQSLMEPLWQR